MYKDSSSTTMSPKLSEQVIQKLIKRADEARLKAYAPYSNFKVGCSILCEYDTVFSGCNVENASYGLTICAERTAILKAVSEGFTKYKAIAVCCDIKDEFRGPCGACRQSISEFTIDIPIVLATPGGKRYTTVEFVELYPMPFRPDALQLERN